MDLEKACQNGECGLCCFIENKDYYPEDSIPADHSLLEYQEYLIKDSDGNYHLRQNPEIQLIVDSETYYPCILMEYEVEGEFVNKMYCKIHPNINNRVDIRPPGCLPREPASEKCQSKDFFKAKGLLIYNNKKYKLRIKDEILKL